jgi:DMSO/TMAO reductase YedYZ heme-binding membrane subunit
VNIVAAGPSPYWYLTRGAGTVALLLLTASVVLGILDFSRWRTERWPRFVTDALHRNVSMLALAMVILHVVTTVADGFTPIGLKDAVIPFLSPYRPLWLGLGALSFDLLLAVAITSMARRRLGYRAWRAVHWTAYGCWPLALVHGLGTGTDTPSGWMLLLTAACILAVLIAVGWRVGAAAPESPGRRLGAGALGAGLVALIVWMVSGPLAGNWAARAGTPASILGALRSGPVAASTVSDRPGLRPPFTARLAGSLHQSASPETGLASIDIRLAMSGGATGPLDVRITGQPVGSGVAMTQGAVSLGRPGKAGSYKGRIIALDGTRMVAEASSADGTQLRLQIELSIDQSTGTVSGTVQAQPASGGAE